MASPQAVKPLVDRILSNPLHFQLADRKSDNAGGSKEEDFIGMGAQKSSYIMIGKPDELIKEPTKDSAPADETSRSAPKRRKVLPTSLEEALTMYTTGLAGTASSVSTPLAGSESTSDSEGNQGNTGPSEPSETEEVFHEPREYAVNGEEVGEDVGEDIGVSEETNSGNSTSEDEDFEELEESSDSSSEGDQQDEEDDSDSEISENERLQLQQEALEADTIENAKAAPQQRQQQQGEKDVQSDAAVEFYQFNEEVNDAGSLKNRRIVKNWGPFLTNLKPRGLLNHGVTCYTNAAIQAMVHIPAVQHYLFDILRGRHADKINQESVSYVLAEITRKMWLPQEKFKKRQPPQYINPRKLLSRLGDINCMMSEWQQEDSHEYFMSLMSRLQEDSVPRGHKLTESIMYDIFGGILEQVVTCKSCGSVSKTEQPFYDLSLHLRAKRKQSIDGSTESDSTIDSRDANSQQEIQSQQQSPRRFSIEKSISDFFNPELIKVDKEQKGYVCESCHMTTNAIKHNSILRAPETLLVHLKKFRFNGTSSSKMKQAVSYPMFLDLTKYCVEGKEIPLKYQLITVVVHEGRSLSSGHYIVHCKQPEGHWATYDDEYINNISEKEMLREPNAYYLVYTKLTPRQAPLRSPPLNAQDLDIPDQIQSTPTSSPNNARGKKWKKNKKRRFNQ